MSVLLDAEAIQQTIPHRAPFLLVDRILELQPGQRILGAKDVRPDDPWFAGHFPDFPVMPGVLIVEALAQTAAVLMMHGSDGSAQYPLFAGIDKARFRRQVVPGDELQLELTVLQQRSTSCKLAGVARVGDEIALQTSLFAILADGG